MKSTLTTLCLLLALCAIGCSEAADPIKQGTAPTPRITGQFILDNGNPVGDAAVVLWERTADDQAKALYETKTDADGRFSFGESPSDTPMAVTVFKPYSDGWSVNATFELILEPGESRKLEPTGLGRSAPASYSEPHGPEVVSDSPPIVTAARQQIGKTTIYDGAYVGLSYPGGDVPIERGVCTDVVVRALRDAHGMDLQQLVHEDMKANFAAYPTIWGLSNPDKNIDHRRVPNLQTYFNRRGFELETGSEASDFKPGDLVSCTVGGNRPHIMVVSNKISAAGVPLVIHNIGRGAVEEDRLFDFPITGQYRVNHP